MRDRRPDPADLPDAPPPGGGPAVAFAVVRIVLWGLFALLALWAATALMPQSRYETVAVNDARALRAAAALWIAYAFCRGLDLAATALERLVVAARGRS